jgi:kynurenine formamidase
MCLSGTTHHDHGGMATTVPDRQAGRRSPRRPDHDGDGAVIARRRFLLSGMGAAGGAVLASMGSALPATAAPPPGRGRPDRTIDLTYRLIKDFPSFYGTQPVISDVVTDDFDTTGFFSKSWTFPEHIGTHMDAPGHFAQDARLVDDLTAAELIAPLVVVDISAKADEDPNAMLEVADLLAWERSHGRIPQGALVAMNSGWEERFGDPDTFLGGAGFPDLNFPGFSIDAAEWLVAHRDPVGIGVDTPSLDPGNSSTFPVHFGFLATDRYGVENLANLSAAPVRNGMVFVGAIPWEDGSGGPCRVIVIH